MKRILTLAAIALLALAANAYDFEVDGIYYNILNDDKVEVTSSPSSNGYSGDVTIPESVTYNGTTYSVTSIGDNAFYGRSGMTSVTIPNSVTAIGFNAFYACRGLTSINIPNSVTYIHYEAFYGCQGLSSIVVESGNPIFDSRENCNAIIETGSKNLFMGCKNTIIPNSVTSIGYAAFSNCIGLTSINIPNSVTYIGEFAFWYCIGLTSINIPNSVTDIGARAFIDCRNLTSITIPNSVTSIGYNAFKSCSISKLIISGEGKWQAGAIGISTFLALYVDSRITSLNGINVNPSRGVYCYAATPPSCDGNTFTDYSGKLHVPATSLAAYFTADYWCNFTNIVGDAVEPTMVTLGKDSIEMRIGDEPINLTASVIPTNATPNAITWSSTNPAVASVNNGKVSAVGVGECDIIAQCLYNRAICHVMVNDTTVTIALDQQEAMVLPNHIIILTPSASPVMPELTVASSNPSVASARLANGKVQVVGIKEGSTTITVGSADGAYIPATCLVTVYTEPGDVNCDGFVNISDVTDLIDYLLGSDVTNFKAGNADLDSDGNVNISDVTTLIDYLLSGHW